MKLISVYFFKLSQLPFDVLEGVASIMLNLSPFFAFSMADDRRVSLEVAFDHASSFVKMILRLVMLNRFVGVSGYAFDGIFGNYFFLFDVIRLFFKSFLVV